MILSPEAEVLDWTIVASLIKVSRRLTYHEVDDLLTQDRTLMALSRLTTKIKEARLALGGFELKLPEVWVNFTSQGELQVTEEDRATPSRQLVAEAMVLANSLAARSCPNGPFRRSTAASPSPGSPSIRGTTRPCWNYGGTGGASAGW